MAGMPAPSDVETLLQQTRRLVAESRQAMVVSRASIASSVSRAVASEERRGSCLPAADMRDMEAADLVQKLRALLDQAAIDREVGYTAANLDGLDRETAFRDSDTRDEDDAVRNRPVKRAALPWRGGTR